MKKKFSLLLLVSTIALSIACSGEDNNKDSFVDVTVQITSEQTIKDYSNFQVTVTELKSGTTFTEKASVDGKVTFQLPLGSYSVVAEDLINGASTLYGRVENVVVASSAPQITLKVAPITSSLEKSFVLDELYFNCDKNGIFQVYYERYLTIRNVSDRPLYADGLSIAICGDYNSIEVEKNEMDDYLKKDTLVIGQLYTIPGDGRTYRVDPGQSLVLANSAINHKLDKDGKEDSKKIHSIDLSGANFEFFVADPYVQTVDNPEVPNMIVDHAANKAFNWEYNGSMPIMLVKLTKEQREKMVKNQKMFSRPGLSWMKLPHLLMPVTAIIDGVETGYQNNLIHKALPTSVDRSAILVNTGMSGFDGQFIKRKEVIDAKGRRTVQDTNNSGEDFEIIVHGQKSYPKK